MFDNNRTYTARQISGLYIVHSYYAYASYEREIFNRANRILSEFYLRYGYVLGRILIESYKDFFVCLAAK